MRLSKCLFLCIFALLSSCNFAPFYQRPCMELPSHWKFAYDEGSTDVNIRWWEELGDPILNTLIVQALYNNKDLKTAMWRVCTFYAQYQVASSLLYPQINSEGFALRERFPTTSFFPPGFNPITPHYRYAFNLAYEIDFWGRVRNQSQAAYEEFLAAVENRRTVVLSLVASVAQTYIRIRELDKELEIAYATVQDREEYVALAIKRFEGGLTSEIEVEQAISILEETKAIVVRLNTAIPMLEDLLSVLLGENPSAIVRGKAINQLNLPFCVPAGLPSELLERRPDIMGAERKLMAAQARIGVARANFFPKISLTGSFGGESFQFSDLFSAASRAWDIGGAYTVDIFTGGRLTGELNATIAMRQELLYQYEQTILVAFKEVSDALIAHQQSKELVSVQKRRVEAVSEYLKLAWLRYYNGQTDYLTVLDAERELFRAQVDVAKAQGDIFLTLVDLYKSLGGGWVLDADSLLFSVALGTHFAYEYVNSVN